jgi:hypothetical protein
LGAHGGDERHLTPEQMARIRGSSKTIFTGTLDDDDEVARDVFCGSTLNCAPVPRWMLSACSRKTRPDKRLRGESLNLRRNSNADGVLSV